MDCADRYPALVRWVMASRLEATNATYSVLLSNVRRARHRKRDTSVFKVFHRESVNL